MTSLAHEYYQVFLAQGICIGLGGGLLYVPSTAAAATSFNHAQRPLALGIVASGAGVGEFTGLNILSLLRCQKRWRSISHHLPPVTATARIPMGC